MRVGLDVGGRLDLDDARDVAHVDAAGRDVSRDERLDAALTERREGAVALGLLHLTRQRAHHEACLGQLAGDARHVRAGAREDE